jgi:hypothetical protein
MELTGGPSQKQLETHPEFLVSSPTKGSDDGVVLSSISTIGEQANRMMNLKPD